MFSYDPQESQTKFGSEWKKKMFQYPTLPPKPPPELEELLSLENDASEFEATSQHFQTKVIIHQKKHIPLIISTFQVLPWEKELQNKTERNQERKNQERQKIIVVASLIDKAPNLGIIIISFIFPLTIFRRVSSNFRDI